VKKKQAPKAFQLFELAWFGRNELKTLKYAEVSGPHIGLTGKSLFCGLYLNELLTRSLQADQNYPNLYALYETALLSLGACSDQQNLIEIILRRFELSLLSELGFGLSLDCDTDGYAIKESSSVMYRYVNEHGLVEVTSPEPSRGYDFSGTDLIRIANESWDTSSLKAAKRLTRVALAPILGDKPLKSRELFL
jgi:DNA repair protein RecO (recombination protein O)